MIKILIVDDNVNNRMTLKLLLEECPNCSIQEASNGKEAVQKCIDNIFDLVFMDIMMPVMDGIEATRQIRSFDHSVLIVAVSAMGDDNNKQRILSAGAKDYMTKPINPDLFLKRFENYHTLITWRKTQRTLTWSSPNLFDLEIFAHASLFYLRSESDISEAWEYLISLDTFSGEAASDAIQTYFNAALALLEKKNKSELLLEENETYYILTLLTSAAWNEEEMTKIVAEHFTGEYRVGPNSFSLLISKNIHTKLPIDPAKIGLDEATLKVLRHSHTDKISATMYVQEMSMEFTDKLDTLELLEDSMDQAIFALQNGEENSFWIDLCQDMDSYAGVIESLYEFQHIAFAMATLVTFINEVRTYEIQPKERSKLLLILKSILDDLSAWRRTIFVTCETEDIHYLDSSLLSSCLQAQMIFEEKAGEGDDDLELF